MLLIPCPWCGPCAHTEFSYGGDATRRRPADPEQCSDREWLDYVYLRDNPCGMHLEWWQHNAGCRQWIQVLRNTATHKISGAWDADASVRVPDGVAADTNATADTTAAAATNAAADTNAAGVTAAADTTTAATPPTDPKK